MAKKQATKKTAGRTRAGTTTKGAKAATPRTTRTRDPRLPAPGTTITRRYKGRDLRLTVLDEGFGFEGEVYRSLTATALKATGYPAISGPHFWKLDAQSAATPKAKKKRAVVAEPKHAAPPPAAAPAATATA